MTTIRGIAWNHSRGNIPVMATAQRYMELHSDVKIIWDTRSLHDFGGANVDELSKKYDLMVVDHPWTGFAYAHNSYTHLEDFIDREFLAEQKKNSVGSSYESYTYDNHQLALAIDAASPIAFYSNEKLIQNKVELPKTYEDVLDLAKDGLIACSGNGTSLLMQLYMFCDAISHSIFENNMIAERDVLDESLNIIDHLFSYLKDEYFYKNPIGIYEELSNKNKKALYTPFDFGYSNYSRLGYGDAIISSANTVTYKDKPLRTILGGAGLALSTRANNKDIAVDYMKYCASPIIQESIYVENGGQPGHRLAWESDRANYITNDFFRNTLDTLDRAILRPRFNGYLEFQEEATVRIKDYMLKNISRAEILDFLDKDYKKICGNGDKK